MCECKTILRLTSTGSAQAVPRHLLLEQGRDKGMAENGVNGVFWSGDFD